MHNNIKKLSEFHLFEGVNEDLVKAKADVNEKQAEIAEEIAKQKEATDLVEKAASIRRQATLTGQMPALLNALANAMQAKADSGDTTNIY
jgi:acyl-CoA hydrolase